MSYRTWLKDVKSIHNLGPHYLHKRHRPWDEDADARADAKWSKKLQEPIPVEPEFVEFFATRMHDSWVIGLERTDDQVTIRLNSIYADIFAWALAEVLEVDRVPSAWPVHLVLHDVVYMRSARHDPNGALRYANWRELRSTEFTRGDTFLYDWFFEQDGRIQWIAEFDARRLSLRSLSSSMYLMVDCARVSAVDLRREALGAAYGPMAAELWDQALLDSGTDMIWGVRVMEKYLLDQFGLRGLSLADFSISE
jgi:hypothetical protein